MWTFRNADLQKKNTVIFDKSFSFSCGSRFRPCGSSKILSIYCIRKVICFDPSSFISSFQDIAIILLRINRGQSVTSRVSGAYQRLSYLGVSKYVFLRHSCIRPYYVISSFPLSFHIVPNTNFASIFSFI